MPYLITRDGKTEFIADQKEFNEREAAEWGSQVQQKPTAKPVAPKPAATTAKPAAKPTPKRGFDIGRFLQNAAQTVGNIKVPKTWKDAGRLILNELSGLNPSAQLAGVERKEPVEVKQAREKRIAAAEKTAPTLAEEAKRIVPRTVQQAINTAVAIPQQMAAEGLTGTGFAESLGLLPKDEKRQRDAAVVKKALTKTGRTPEGYEYGWRPDWVGGQYLSNDSPWVQQNIKPKSELTEFAAQLGGALGLSKVIKLFTKAPTVPTATRQIQQFEQVVSKNTFKNGLKAEAAYLINTIAPETIKDSFLFPVNIPPINAKRQAEYDKIRNELSPEVRLNLAEAMLSDNDDEFNFFQERAINAGFGVGAMYGFRGLMALGRRALQLNNAGVPANKAFDFAADEVGDSAYADFKTSAYDDINKEIQSRLGQTTTAFSAAVGQNTPIMAQKARSASEGFVTRYPAAISNRDKILGELAQFGDITAKRAELDAQVAEAQKAVGVETPEQLVAKLQNLEQRLAAYDAAQAADPDWINKSTGTGKRASKNSSKVRQVKEAIDAIKRFEDLSMQRQTFGEIDQQQLIKTTELTKADTEIIASKNDFQKVVSELKETLNEHQRILDVRGDAVEAEIAQRMREGTAYEDILPDSFYEDPAFQVNESLNRLVQEAQDAINFDQLSPEYIDNWLERLEDLHDQAITDGVSAMPLTPDTTGLEDLLDDVAAAVPEEAQTNLKPRKPYPMENRVPLTEDEVGNPVLNQDEINVRNNQGLETLQAESPENIDPEDFVDSIKRSIGTNQKPKTEAEFNQIADEIIEFDRKYQAALEDDLINGTNNAEKQLRIFRAANATTYTADLTDQQLLKVVSDRVAKEGLNMQTLALKAVMQLQNLSNDPRGLKELQYLIEQRKINEKALKNLPNVVSLLSLLDKNTRNAMAAVRTVQQIQNGSEASGLTLEEGMALALDQMRLMFATVKAVDPLAQNFGTGLGLFAASKRLYMPKNGDLLANEWNQKLIGIGDIDEVIESASKAAELAQADFDEKVGGVLKKLNKGEQLTDEEIGGALNLIDKVRFTNGNISRIKELEMTKGAVAARIMTSGIYNALAGPSSVVVSGFMSSIGRLGARSAGSFALAAGMKLLGNTKKAEVAWNDYRESSKWLSNYIYGVSATVPHLYNKLIFPTPNSVYDQKVGSLVREDAILDDLKAESFNIKTPFGEWVASKENVGEIYETLNKGRVLFKVFHDAFIPGEALEKADKMAKLLGYSVSIPHRMGIGARSFYPNGENENMTFVFRLLGLADDIVSSITGNAWHKTKIEFEIEDEVLRGFLKQEDAAAELKKRLTEKTEKFFNPVTAGSDSAVIGYKIHDQQFEAFRSLITQTESLTGSLGAIENTIQYFKNSKNPQIAAFASYMMPATTQTANWLKQMLPIATGFEVGVAALDTVRSTASMIAKNLPEATAVYLRNNNPRILKSIIDFESKYTSEDYTVRTRAVEALALTLGLHAIAFQMVWNGDYEITDNMSQTYRSASKDKPFTITANIPFTNTPLSVDYRYITPYFGQALAAQAIMRNLHQFESSDQINNWFGMVASVMANNILDTPTLAGADKVIEMLQKQADGDSNAIIKFAGDFASKYGNPHHQLTKQIVRSLRAAKPADLTSMYQRKAVSSTAKISKKKPFDIGKGVQDTLLSLADFGMGIVTPNLESNGLQLLFDAVPYYLNMNPKALEASRQALWYGKPGELISYAKLPQLAYPIQAVTDRFLPYYGNTDDPVYQAIRDNFVLPPGPDLFKEKGIKISKTLVNNFNHYLNSEARFLDEWTGETHVGMYAYINSLIKRPEYKNRSQVTSPFKGKDYNWARETDPGTIFIKSKIRTAVNLAKTEWVNGDNQILDPKTGKYRPQYYKAPPELKDLFK